MSEETKILIENIKNFRHLITEGVSQDTIVKAIENHEWVYLYYNGDDKNKTGYRTIRPYVLGTSTAGNTVLRAWQDNPRNSWHFDNKPTRQDSQYHDYWTDSEGTKPGWRMFDVSKISKIYPIGKKFNDANGLPMIPAGYHEGGDKDMTSIIAYVSTKNEPDFDYSYDKEFKGDEISKKDRDRAKWDSIRRGNKNARKITADDVVKLRDVASRVQKTAHGNYLVAIDDKKDFQLIQVKDKDKQNIPDIAIVGSLPQLYDSLVNVNKPQNDKFFNDKLNQTQTAVNQTQTEVNEIEQQSIPYKKMTFFK